MCAAVAMEPEERGELESSSGLLERMDQELAALIQKGKRAKFIIWAPCHVMYTAVPVLIG